jgi:hypothetical protein
MLKGHFGYKAWLTFFFVVFLFSCRKEQAGVSIPKEIIAERFFNEYRTNSTEEKQLIDYLSKLNEKNDFITKTVERIGFPRWDKLVKYSFLSNSSGRVATNSTVSTGGQDSATNYIIPFVRDTENHVNAAMFIKTDKGDTTISYLCDWQYSNFRTPAQISKPEDVAIFFMLFDRQVNGHKNFDVLDSALFRKDNKKAFSVSFKNNDSSKTFGFSSFSCISYTILRNKCVLPGNCKGYQGDCDWCDLCIEREDFSVCYWVASVSPSGNDFGGGGTPGSGSNVGGSGNNDGPVPPSNDDGLRPGWRFSGKGRFNTMPVFDPKNPFDNLDNPINASDDVIIENGVSVSDDVDVPTNPIKIAKTQKRGNIEDMQHGTAGDPIGILPISLLASSDQQLFQKMSDLFYSCTFLDNDLSIVGDDMIKKFKNKSGGYYSNNVLNSKVAKSSSLINFVKKFGDKLNDGLKMSGGDISRVPLVDMGKTRPIFNGFYNKFHGLQILINDTELTEIHLDNFIIDGSGKWSADITITIHDHFGLDKNDALIYQDKHEGFPSWWLLQHTRDYIPFETIVVVRKKISSQI